MSKNLKTYFQDIHYCRKKPTIILYLLLSFAELFYKIAINIKNYLYEIKFLKETEVKPYVICIGNLTTGGVGKTPITIELANNLSKEKKVAIISRGYGSKLNTKIPQIIKDYKGIRFKNGLLCGDEPFQIANKVSSEVVVIICKNRLKAVNKAYEEFNSEIIIMDDGFSNRQVKKDKNIIVTDSKMQFGNKHLLPLGPLREPVEEIKRADEIYIVNKSQDDDTKSIINDFKNLNKKLYLCKMEPNRIYDAITKANTIIDQKKNKAVAFCAIGQPQQFFDFAKKYYNITQVIFEDHHKYSKKDILNLIKIADKNKTNIFITTQKDETKIKEFILNYTNYRFNVLELKNKIEEITI